jgi:cytochrome bd-type quinol oxidase subunit 2
MDRLVQPTEATSPPFSFVWLEKRIAECNQDIDDTVMTPFERYAVIGVVATGGLSILAYLLLRNRLGLQIVQAGVVLQWAFALIALIRIGHRAWRAYKRQYMEIAADLDSFYVRYRQLIEALRTYPAPEIARHLRYIRDRKTTLIYRHLLLSGGMEKLGILPLVALLYLQFRDWSFGDWKGLLDHVHLVGGLLLWMLLITYCIVWWAARTKGRLDVYEALLAEANVGNAEIDD